MTEEIDNLTNDADADDVALAFDRALADCAE